MVFDEGYIRRSEKNKIRFDSLLKIFKQKHSAREPLGLYESHIFDLLVRLGDVYDENSDKIHKLFAQQKRAAVVWTPGLQQQLYICRRREAVLNNISKQLRLALDLTVGGANLNRTQVKT